MEISTGAAYGGAQAGRTGLWPSGCKVLEKTQLLLCDFGQIYHYLAFKLNFFLFKVILRSIFGPLWLRSAQKVLIEVGQKKRIYPCHSSDLEKLINQKTPRT